MKLPASQCDLAPGEREEVLQVARYYERLKGGSLDWEDLRNRALAAALGGDQVRFANVTAVLADEYQDFSTTSLKLIQALAKACRGNTFFAGDERQRIYRSSSNFLQLGIEVRGRALALETNYRNTEQIAGVARHLAQGIKSDEEALPRKREDLPDLQGSRPVLAGFLKPETEADWIASHVHTLIEDGYLPGEIGIITPNWKVRNICSASLRRRRLPHFILEGDTAGHFFEEGSIKVSTYHQAKGLEYKVLFCAGLGSECFREEHRYRGFEGRSTLNSLLYIAVTRARDHLYLSFSGVPLRWLGEIDHSLVELQGAYDLIIKGRERLEEERRRKEKGDQGSLF